MKRNFFLLVSGLLIMVTSSCKQSTMDYAKKWTADIKTKVLEDASQQPDSTFTDTIHHEITFLKGSKKLRQLYMAARKTDDDNAPVIFDTARIVYYSTDQNFQYIYEPCIQGKESSYEGVLYKYNRYGMAEYKYCEKDEKSIVFIFKNLRVGTEIHYDASSGKEIEKKELGNEDKLENLRQMKYYR